MRWVWLFNGHLRFHYRIVRFCRMNSGWPSQDSIFRKVLPYREAVRFPFAASLFALGFLSTRKVYSFSMYEIAYISMSSLKNDLSIFLGTFLQYNEQNEHVSSIPFFFLLLSILSDAFLLFFCISVFVLAILSFIFVPFNIYSRTETISVKCSSYELASYFLLVHNIWSQTVFEYLSFLLEFGSFGYSSKIHLRTFRRNKTSAPLLQIVTFTQLCPQEKQINKSYTTNNIGDGINLMCRVSLHPTKEKRNGINSKTIPVIWPPSLSQLRIMNDPINFIRASDTQTTINSPI